MSILTLFYGQCGSQISDELYSTIDDDAVNSKKDFSKKWFRLTPSKKLEPRAILVDTELKTVPPKNKRYNFPNVVSKSMGGCANNWAFGYQQSKLIKAEILNCVRQELEKSDAKVSFLNVFSTAGGTGAGAGSAMVETLKNEFPSNFLTCAVILPYVDGEVVTQNYNTLLALSKLNASSDATFLFENDRLHYTCVNSMNIKDVTFKDLNRLLTHQLLSVFQALKDVETEHLLRKLCPSSLKFLQIRLTPLSKLENASNWNSLLASISRQSRFDFHRRNQCKTNLRPKNLSTAFISRGLYKPAENEFKHFTEINHSNLVQIYHDRRNFLSLENSLSVVSNSNNVFLPLNLALQDARNLLKFGAYLHHYKKYFVDEAHFNLCFNSIADVLNQYKTL